MLSHSKHAVFPRAAMFFIQWSSFIIIVLSKVEFIVASYQLTIYATLINLINLSTTLQATPRLN